MYLSVGQNVLLPEASVVGIFDLDNSSWSWRTRDFLARAEKEGRVRTVGEGLPRAFVLCREGDAPPLVYLTTLTSAALRARARALPSPRP